MTKLLQQAIDCDDPDQAAKIIQDALGIESDDVWERTGLPARSACSGVEELRQLLGKAAEGHSLHAPFHVTTHHGHIVQTFLSLA
jgi:hypothetical protein